MKIRNIIAVLGSLFTILGLFLILPLLISLFQHDAATPAFLFSIAVATGVGLLMQIRKPRNFNIQRWEAMVIVVIGWDRGICDRRIAILFQRILRRFYKRSV